jgi:hypothetical protein
VVVAATMVAVMMRKEAVNVLMNMNMVLKMVTAMVTMMVMVLLLLMMTMDLQLQNKASLFVCLFREGARANSNFA